VSASPAAEEAGGPSDFVIFANGVLNEINKQILEMQEKVSTIYNGGGGLRTESKLPEELLLVKVTNQITLENNCYKYL
jgi:hypothetical protein